ncbi:MAG: dihydropteroate synthase, partial [Candidatus Omnitrophica bacterium]|nr:dihydropteroate synthase [Candidatus Omnitrophota bacterium]
RGSVSEAYAAGIDRKRIIIDPGIGFGKTTMHNLQIIKELKDFTCLDLPILIGTSRKSFIGDVLNLPVEERMLATAATVAASIFNGAHIVRVHDVKETVQASRMVDAILNSQENSG